MHRALSGGGHHGGHHGGGGGFFNPMFWGGWGYPSTTEIYVVDDQPVPRANCPVGYVAVQAADGRWMCVAKTAVAQAKALSGIENPLNPTFLAQAWYPLLLGAAVGVGGVLLYQKLKRKR